MEQAGLKIVLESDAQGAIKGIEAVNKSLNTIPAAANKAGAALGKVGNGAANATPALINFGRVIQDAPFGLIGIANNIDPLISSFQSLKTASGSTGAAFKALAGSLLGPAGIGIAVSAVTSALIAFGPKLFGASKEAKELDKALTGVASSAAEDLVKLQTYVSFAQDASKATSERQKAVKALQQEYPQYLKNISEEAILTGQATDAINKSIDAILKKATIKLLQDEIAKVVEGTAKQIIQLEKQIAVNKQSAIAEQERAVSLKETKKALAETRAETIQSGKASSEALNKLALSAERAFAQKPEDRIKKLKEELIQLVAPLLNISNSFKDFGDNSKDLTDTTNKTKEFSDFVQNLKVTLEQLSSTAAKDPFAKINADTQKLVNQFQELKAKGKLTAQDIIDAPGIISEIDRLQKAVVNTELFNAESKRAAEESAKNWALVYKLSLNRELSNIVPAIPEISAEDATKSLRNAILGLDVQLKNLGLKTLGQLEDFDAQVTDLLNSIARDAVSSIAQGIGNALAGSKNPFDGLLLVLANGLESLGKMVIATFLTIQALQDVLKSVGITNPVVGIAIGAAMVALGAFIKSKVSQTKFADGGIVTGPTNALIGEAGPEVVFPLDRVREFLGNDRGTMSPIVLTTRVSGQDLILVQQRAGASFKRTNG